MIYHIVHICSVSPQNGWSIVFSNQQDNCRDVVTSENTKQTWEEIQRTYLEKWSPKYFCHLLMMRPRIRHLTLSLWPCQKRKCKMENRTNPKLIPWQILACRNYEKSFTCCWDIKEEGCPLDIVQYCSPPLHGVPHAAVGGGALPGAPPLPLPCLHHHQLPPVAVHPSGSKRFEPKLCRIVL